jgi:toxin ParE1/3/4
MRIQEFIYSLFLSGTFFSNPFLGRVPKDDRLKNKGYRMLVVDKYLVFYIVKNKTIQIRRIIHGARNYNFLM